MFGQRVGGILVGQRAGDDARCGNPLPLNAVESCSMPCWVSNGRSSSCRTRMYLSLSTSLGRSSRSMTFQRGHSGSAKSSAISALGRTTTWSQRSRPESSARPSR